MTWCPPSLTLIWGQYFAPDADDDTKIVALSAAALSAGLITKRAAVRKVARTFNIDNVDQFLETLEEESAEKRQQLTDDMHAMSSSGAVSDDDTPETPAKPTVKAKQLVGE